MLSLGQPEVHGHPAPGDEPEHTGISLVARDLRATLDDLRAKGAKIIEEPQEMPWGGLGGHFADPDGNIFFVA